jgi:predicted nucleic acid-binding protein
VIFIDAGAYVASIVPSDADHAAAVAWFAQNREPLFTTDYVLDEVLTLLRARGAHQQAIEMGERLLLGRQQLYYITLDDLLDAFNVFRNFYDKDWSFTDCTSYVVMKRLGITTACSFDHHFKQFGIVAVVP